MSQTYKVLAQVNPGATTLTDAYTVPASTETVVSTITICNRSATATSFRISIAVAGAADANQQYIFYDCPIGGNATQAPTLGLSLGAGDIIRVYATLATLSFNVFGAQLT